MVLREKVVVLVVACSSATLACSGGGSPTAPGAPTTGGGIAPAQTCRTYVSAGINTTVSSAFTATVTLAGGTYNTATNQTALNVNYSDTRGIAFSYVQTASYRSVADFVNEVVSSSGNTGQSSRGSNTVTDPSARWTAADVGRGIYVSDGFGSDNYRVISSVNSPTTLLVSGTPATTTATNITWAASVIPPLTLSTAITGAGGNGIPFTITNLYDAQGRLTGFDTVTLNVSVPTRYTAWDGLGRPTAGTTTNLGSTSALALSYDDALRTLTTTTTTNGLVFVGTQTFDVNGNPTRYQARDVSGAISTTTTTIGSTATVCK